MTSRGKWTGTVNPVRHRRHEFISSLLLTSLLFLRCSEAPEINEEPTGRTILAEDFSFARCIYCPYAEEALDSLFGEYDDSFAVIIYHRRMLGDTLSPAYVSARESLYQINASPTVIFDGTNLVQTEDPNQDYYVYKNWIIHERNIAPQLRLHLETRLVSASVNLKLHIVSVDSINNGNYYIFVVLYEDSVYFPQAGAPESTFSFVMRKMIPDENGIPIDLAYPDSMMIEMDFTLQSNWDTRKLGIVAFVQNMASKEVLQATVNKRIFATTRD